MDSYRNYGCGRGRGMNPRGANSCYPCSGTGRCVMPGDTMCRKPSTPDCGCGDKPFMPDCGCGNQSSMSDCGCGDKPSMPDQIVGVHPFHAEITVDAEIQMNICGTCRLAWAMFQCKNGRKCMILRRHCVRVQLFHL